VAALIGVAKHHGGADVLINNAGINIPKPAEELSIAEWSQIPGSPARFWGSMAAGWLHSDLTIPHSSAILRSVVWCP
jgi:NAD(P)-dependent dehydrogenase (short-subunit alcohol dehydrogenase family)